MKRNYLALLPKDLKAIELVGRDFRTAAQRWRTTFVPEVKVATGKWTYRGFDWHAFSYEHSPSLQGDGALSAYRDRTDRECLVFFGPTLDVGYRLEGSLPEWPPGTDDIYVCSMRFTWTMVFTHESDLGPYFRDL